MSEFRFYASAFVPFRDRRVIERVLRKRREDFARHRNAKFRIRVMTDEEVEFRWVVDLFSRIKEASDFDRPLVVLTPGPGAPYGKVAQLINAFGVRCRRLHTFNSFEFANDDGESAPADWPQSTLHQFKRSFHFQIDAKLRAPDHQIQGPTHRNLSDYGRMIADLGGADVCYSSPGWMGSFAGVEPNAPEFKAKSLKQWLTLGPRICALSPFTIAQHSLSCAFGRAGNLTAVPPKVATVGPAEVVGAKARIDLHTRRISGCLASAQRLISRLCIHGPVTPLVPNSLHQLLETECWVGESVLAEDTEDEGPPRAPRPSSRRGRVDR